MKLIYRILCLSIVFLLALTYQNCSPIGHQKGTLPPASKVQGGNGDGYTGIQINGPDMMNPGQQAKVQVLGGQAPYTVTSSSPDVEVRETGVSHEFFITVSEDISESSFTISAADKNNLSGAKTILLTRLPVESVLDGYGGHFGRSLDLWGRRAVAVGVNFDNPDYDMGALFTFFYRGAGLFDQRPTLLSSDNSDWAFWSLDAHQDWLLTGSQYKEIAGLKEVGVADLYRFQNEEWAHVTRIDSPHVVERLGFGSSVSLSDEGLAIGSGAWTAEGRVYLYDLAADGTVTPDTIIYDPYNNYNFGRQVKRFGDLLFVSSLDASLGFDPAKNPGQVDVFRRENQTWRHEAHLKASPSPSPREHNACGSSLDYDGEVLVVGCPRQLLTEWENWPSSSGAVDVYIYKDGNWIRAQQLTPDTRDELNQFGRAVSVHNGLLAVGAPFESAVYVYRFNQVLEKFERIKKITKTDIGEENSIGISVAVHNNRILMGTFATFERFAVIYEVTE